MGPIGFLACAQLRRRRRALGALAVLVGVIGGLAIGLLAGSRRSASVVDRYFAAGIPYDLQLAETSLTRGAVLDLPGVVRADPNAYVAMMRVAADGRVIDGINGIAVDWSSVDPTMQVLEGAVPDGTDPFEVVVNEALVELNDLAVGDAVEVQMFGPDQGEEVAAGNYQPTGPRYTFRIASVVRLPIDIAEDEVHSIAQSASASPSGMFVSHEFYDTHHEEFLNFGVGYDIQLDGARARDGFIATVQARAREHGEPAHIGQPRFQDRRASLESPVELETNALLLLGVAIALAGIVTIALLLRAEQRYHEHDVPTLRALGYTSRQLGATAVLRNVPVALGGAVLAMFIAVAASSRFPVGIGRQLELDRGVELDVAVVTLGGAVSILVILGLSYLIGHAGRRRDPTARGRPSLAGRVAGVGAPTEVVIGAQLAFARGQGSRSTPARAGIAGGAVAIAVVAAVGIYVAGVDRLYSVPAARGWAWDAVIGNVNFPISDATVERLTDDSRLEATTVARVCEASIGDQVVEVLAVQRDGTAPPVLASGRLPASASEIALGARLGRRLDARVGDLVRFSVAGSECEADEPTKDLDLTVVGVAVPPVFGDTDIGRGAVVTLDAMADAGGDDTPQFVMAKFGGDDPRTVGASLDRDLTEEILTDSIPAEVVNLHGVRDLPLIGLVLAGTLGAIVLAYSLALGRSGRMRDLAVLRTLGLSTPQLRRVLAWQGAVLAGTMVLVGLPIGVVIGSAVWRRSADGLGVGAGPITPRLFLLVPLCGLAAIVATLHPARRARRTSVATLLRVE